MVYIAKEEDKAKYWEAALAMLGEAMSEDEKPQKQPDETQTKMEDQP